MYVDRSDAEASVQTGKNDPRVTRVGRFIRKTSLDEFPQFLNVLSGKMSVVRAAPACAGTKAEGRSDRSDNRDLRGPSPGQAWLDRVGAGQRLSRRTRYGRKGALPRRLRYRLHRELVDAAGSEDHPHDGRPAGLRSRGLLKSRREFAAPQESGAPAPPRGRPSLAPRSGQGASACLRRRPSFLSR